MYEFISQNLLNIWTWWILFITLLILAIYAKDTKIIAEETKNARLDTHLPVLDFYKSSQKDKTLSIEFKNLGFNYFKISEILIDNKKQDKTDIITYTDLDGSNKHYDLKITLDKELKEENKYKILIYCHDIHGRTIYHTVKLILTKKPREKIIIVDGIKNYLRDKQIYTEIEYKNHF